MVWRSQNSFFWVSRHFGIKSINRSPCLSVIILRPFCNYTVTLIWPYCVITAIFIWSYCDLLYYKPAATLLRPYCDLMWPRQCSKKPLLSNDFGSFMDRLWIYCGFIVNRLWTDCGQLIIYGETVRILRSYYDETVVRLWPH